MTAQYDRNGLQFLYPDGWELSEDHISEQSVTVSVANEVGAFWSVSRHLGKSDFESLAPTALSALKEEYEGLESEVIRRELAGVRLEGFEVNFYVQQLIASGQMLACIHNGDSYLILCQAEDRDFDTLEPVFQAITISMLKAAQLPA